MSKFKKITVAVIVLFMLFAAGACGSAPGQSNDKISIIASDFPSYDFAKHVAGDLADVKLLLKPGESVHSYEPSPKDIINITKCDLFVYAGGESDAWAEKILESGEEKTDSFAMMDAVSLYAEEEKEGMQTEEEGEEEEEEYDEHVWTSPVNAIAICEGIRDRLSLKFPEYASEFEENCRNYTEKIGELDEKFKELFTEVKSENKNTVLIFGDRFPFLYFVKEYGLEYYAAFPGCSEETEPNPKTVIFLEEKIREWKVKKVFYIEFSTGKLAKVLAEETGAEAVMLHSCHNVTKTESIEGETYLSLMTKNYGVLKEAFSDVAD